ncbi:MAG: serine/threonine protein kinase, partial [Gammaproteobacteria bacterium]
MAEHLDSTPQALENSETPYYALSPDVILDAVESYGVRCTGAFLALNSYENRVYQVGIEDSAPLVAKFYRPGRWSDEAILEEHAYTLQLAGHEIPVVPPLMGVAPGALPPATQVGETLFHYKGFRFALFPRQGGRSPDLENAGQREWVGRFMGRIHAVGATQIFRHRPTLTMQEFGYDAAQFLLEHGFIPADLELAYRSLVEDLLRRVSESFARTEDVKHIRLHGDCHPGNILWTDRGPHFVDFDDCRMGPAVQDIWMLLSGERAEQTIQLTDILEGYCDFHDFDPRELQLIEPLRTLRMIHYS